MKFKQLQFFLSGAFLFGLFYELIYYDYKPISAKMFSYSNLKNNQPSEKTKSSRFESRVQIPTHGLGNCKYCTIPLKCESWKSSTSELNNFKQEPKFVTKNDRFLIPWLYNGPFNQLAGFRQAAFLAICLNRTLVLPIFTKHFTDEIGDNSIINANYRFDVADISRILRIITYDEYLQKCGHNVEVMFAATHLNSKWAIDRLNMAEKMLNIKLLKNKYRSSNFSDPIKESPVTADVLPITNKKGRSRYLIKNFEDVNTMYGSNVKCAMYAFPFDELKLRQTKPQGNTDFTNISEKSLHDKIIQATQVPQYISEVAELFIQKEFNNKPFHSIHWRFDDKDFFKFMCTRGGNPQRHAVHISTRVKERCDKIFGADPSTFPFLIRQYLSKVIDKDEQIIIYIATPRSTLNWLLPGIKIHQNKYNIKFYTSHDVVQFLEDENIFNRCKFFKENLNDILSLIDMKLCIRGQIFFRSLLSSWSDEVMRFRSFHKNILPLRSHDVGIFDVITQSASKN